MAIDDIVQYVQHEYPPESRLPDRHPGADDASVGPEWPYDDGINRWPVPDWLQPGRGIPVAQDDIPAAQDDSPSSLRSPGADRGSLSTNPHVLAYYLPFHFYRDTWGIYVLESGLIDVAAMLSRDGGSGSVSSSLPIAYEVLLQHERFHFYCEMACSRAEVVKLGPLYHSYFHHFRAVPLEEALANAHVFRTAFRGQTVGVRGAAKSWMRSQGYGYSDFESWIRNDAFKQGERHLGRLMAPPGTTPTIPRPTEFLYNGLSKRSFAPIYFVPDVGVVTFLKPFPKYGGVRVVVHTNDHPPPHVHLQTSEGVDITRLGWPSREPLPDNLPLSRAQRKAVKSYIDKYGREIDERVRQVYDF